MYQFNQTFKIMKKNKILLRNINIDNFYIKHKKNNILEFICKLNIFNITTNKKKNYEIMAPEILKAKEEKKEYNEKCELWSIGVMIYELYFKEPPYHGDNPNSILKLIKKEDKVN